MGSPRIETPLPLQQACEEVRTGLAGAAARMRDAGLEVCEPDGKLLRPLVAYAALTPALRARVDDRFWFGALAIQMVHEASLLHDDILDGADIRRGAPTLASRSGAAAALVRGDQLLTAAYRVAALAELPPFLMTFIRSVERTVAGEIAQQRGVGHVLSPPEYREAIEGKSGALFGAAVALAAEWSPAGSVAPDPEEVGCRIGALYQMVDDLLDYCSSADTGKPAFLDYSQKKWTFVLDAAGLEGFTLDPSEVVARLFDPAAGDGMARALGRLDSEARETLDGLPADDGLMAAILDSWVERARSVVAAERILVGPGGARWAESRGALPSAPSVEAEVVELAREVGGPSEWGRYFGRHSKSFRFAARLFPPDPRRSIEGVYAFCRFTDDLVDEADVEIDRARARLEGWRSLVRAAYQGVSTGVPLADLVMGEAAREGVPFHYPDELLSGVAMDLDPVHFDRLADLEVYTYRVASVVGGWMTELFGVRDPEVLSRAYALGHAMQLTNILRDVGEDWRADRIYLPREHMELYGVDLAMVDFVSSGRGPIPRPYADLCESLMSVADDHYELAFEALPEIPPFFARPVAVAARVYQGIHDEIRRTGYDNGTRRAYTRLSRKLRLGWSGLADLRRAQASRRGRDLGLLPQAVEVD